MQASVSVSRRIVLSSVALLPVALLYTALAVQMQPVPMHDDYPAVFSFGLQFLQRPSFLQKAAWIFVYQYGDYKLIVENALIALDVGLTHYFHLGFLIWCGNLFPLGIGWVIWKMSFRTNDDFWPKLTYFLPIIFLLAQMSYVENFDWAMCGLQTFPVVFFSLLSLWLLADRARLPGACCCAVLAAFSSANGFLLFPLGVVVLWRQWRRLGVWTLCFALALAVYVYRYFPIPQLPARPLHKLVFFLSFLGSAAENQHRWPIKYGAVALGLGMLGIFALACRRRVYRTHAAAFFAAVWVLLTAAVVTRGRASFPVHVALTMRYRIYSDLFLVFGYGVLADLIQQRLTQERYRKACFVFALAVAVLFCAESDLGGYRFLVQRRERVDFEFHRYEADKNFSPYVNLVWGNGPNYFLMNSRVLLDEVRRRNLYQLPVLPAGRPISFTAPEQ